MVKYQRYYMRKVFICFSILIFFSCSNNELVYWDNYDEESEILANSNHEISRMRYKRIQSKSIDKNKIFEPFYSFIKKYDTLRHNQIKSLIFNQDISSIQKSVLNKEISYEELVKFFIYRIYKNELNKDLYLNSIISLNQNVINEARALDKSEEKPGLLTGIPILVKDNINVKGLKTTAGASAFENNLVNNDAFVIKNLKEHGVLILGKLNMSEWAYYFCRPCPVGYSSIGGQTLNPYGRKVFESGGSSSGSGVSIAANFAVASLGSETSGSILSPSSKNSLVGLKPTIGSISRSGIVPISSFFDTSGPMTTNVLDNAILYNQMIGYDEDDALSYKANPINIDEMQSFDASNLRIGIFNRFIDDSLIKVAIADLNKIGVQIKSFNPDTSNLPYFRNILSSDMKRDLPNYISKYGNKELLLRNVNDIYEFNNIDTILYAPYNQLLFKEIINDTVSDENLVYMKQKTKSDAADYLSELMLKFNFDVFISVDNSMAGIAAAAHYPALTIPMGYRKDGQPSNLTFITSSKNEQLLYNIGYAYEKISNRRLNPKNYK